MRRPCVRGEKEDERGGGTTVRGSGEDVRMTGCFTRPFVFPGVARLSSVCRLAEKEGAARTSEESRISWMAEAGGLLLLLLLAAKGEDRERDVGSPEAGEQRPQGCL